MNIVDEALNKDIPAETLNKFLVKDNIALRFQLNEIKKLKGIDKNFKSLVEVHRKTKEQLNELKTLNYFMSQELKHFKIEDALYKFYFIYKYSGTNHKGVSVVLARSHDQANYILNNQGQYTGFYEGVFLDHIDATEPVYEGEPCIISEEILTNKED